MIITKIERQKKNRQRFSIFVDEKYAFSVSEDVYVRYVLHTGQSLTDEEREQIEYSEMESSVKRIALRYRSYRPRSAKEISDYLHKKEFDERFVQQALQYLQENNLLNDAEYARMFCRDKMMLRPVGKLTMKQLLMKKGIDRTTIDAILSEYFTTESETALALKEGERKYKRITSLPTLTKKKRIYEHLLRRGYDSSLSGKIASQLVKE
ncbi:MAG: RecX family transcriptional regulator [Bacteroidota bacterium]|jgi:regulatory protein